MKWEYQIFPYLGVSEWRTTPAFFWVIIEQAEQLRCYRTTYLRAYVASSSMPKENMHRLVNAV